MLSGVKPDLKSVAANRRREFWERSERPSSLVWPACSSWGGRRKSSTATCLLASTGRCSASRPLCNESCTSTSSATESSGPAFRAPLKPTHIWLASPHWKSSVITPDCSTSPLRLYSFMSWLAGGTETCDHSGNCKYMIVNPSHNHEHGLFCW